MEVRVGTGTCRCVQVCLCVEESGTQWVGVVRGCQVTKARRSSHTHGSPTCGTTVTILCRTVSGIQAAALYCK